MEDFMKSLRAPLSTASSWLKHLFESPTALSALGVLSAGLILAEVNVLSARHYTRWDFSEAGQFTLHDSTKDLVSSLKHPVHITVLLPQTHPLLIDTRHTLDAYRALSPKIHVEYIDPDRDAAEFLALGQKHQLRSQRSESGLLMSEAAAMVEHRGRHWFLSPGDLVEVDAEGQRRPKIETAFSEAILRLRDEQQRLVCFVTGHGEKSIEDVGPDGLAELRRRLELANATSRSVLLGGQNAADNLKSCPTIAIVGPEQPIPKRHEQILMNAWKQGANFFLLLDPLVDEEARLVPTGLEALTRAAGILQNGGFVLEQDPQWRLPRGIGEVFVPLPKPHPITEGLHTQQHRTDTYVILVASQSLQVQEAAVPLLTSSSNATILDHLDQAGSKAKPQLGSGPHAVAAASRTTSTSNPGEPTQEARMVVAGTSNVAESASFRDPSLQGNRRFTLQALAWLTESSPLLSIEPRQPVPAGLHLTEESLAEVLRYVLVYMPITSLCAGIFVLLRRRRGEEKSRGLSPSQKTS